MDLEKFLEKVIALPGLSGNELPVAQFLQEAFAPYCADTQIDPMLNMIAHLPGEKPGKGGKKGPKVYVSAHMDEIGLCATLIEKDGSIRFTQIGGVDPRILPSLEVTVLCDPPLFGVIGAKPPHLLSEEDRKNNYKREDLYVDVGLPYEEVVKRVRVGDRIAMKGPFQKLKGDRVSGKTFDDRASVGIMLLAAEMLSKIRHKAEIYLVCSSQEEVGSRGALTSCYAIDPDIAIAIDVTHGTMPGCGPDETYPLDKVVMSMGPNIHPKLLQAMRDVAKAHKIDVVVSPCPRETWTDASELQVTRSGVPTALIELPLKYMHTTVETLSLETLQESARLLAAYLGGLDENWEETLCF